MKNHAKHSAAKRERAKEAGGKPLNMILTADGLADLEAIVAAKGLTQTAAVHAALRRMAARV